MKNEISVKTLVIGLVAGIGSVLLLGATDAPREDTNGRYQIAAGGSGVGVAYVLDTRTGQVWSSFQGVAPTESTGDKFYAPKLR